MNKNIVIIILGLLIFGAAHSLNAATFTIINGDSENEGLNDQRSVEPVSGNSFNTLGDQRLHVVSSALGYIGGLLQTDLNFEVNVRFDSLLCDEESALLGGGAPVDSFVQFDGAPKKQTLYPAALANLHAGRDLDPDTPELELIFNSDIDFNDACLPGTNLYYGIDDAEHEGSVNFYSVVLHETLHAIGFMTYMDGQGNTLYSYSDPFLDLLFNPLTGQYLDDFGVRNYTLYENHPIVFFGPQTRFRAGGLSAGTELLADALNGERILAPYMYTPQLYDPGSSFSHWDTSLSPTPLMAPFSAEPVVSLSEFELAALYDIGWPVNLPLEDRDGDGIADHDDGYPDDSAKSSWPVGDANKNNLPDDWEAKHEIEHQADNVYADRDLDGLSNIKEYAADSNPVLPDTDGDGLGDWAEVLLGYDPLSQQSCPTADCKDNFNTSVPSVAFDLNYYIHEDVSPDRVVPLYDTMRITPAADGGMFISGYTDYSDGYAARVEGRLVKLDTNGGIEKNFGHNGQITIEDIGSSYGNFGAILPSEDSQGRLYTFSSNGFNGATLPKNTVLGTHHLVWEYDIHRMLASGQRDDEFTPVQITTANSTQTSLHLAVDSQDRLVVAYHTKQANSDLLTVEIKRYLLSGSVDTSFGNNGTFTFQGSDSLRLYGLHINASDDLYLFGHYFGDATFNGASILKVSSGGAVIPNFGDSEVPGLLLAKDTNSLYILDDGFLAFARVDDPDSPGNRQLLRITEYDDQGILEREHLINSLPLDAFNRLSCDRSPSHWLCVADTSWSYTGTDQFQSSALYAQVFDHSFNALGAPVRQLKAKYGGQPFDSEEMISIVYTGNGAFTLVSDLTGGSSASIDAIGVRRFSPASGWDLGFGQDGLSRIEVKGAAEAVTAFAVDEMQHAIAGFSQKHSKINSMVNSQAGLLHFYPNGDRDHSFGPDGFIPVPSDPDGLTTIADIIFDTQKDLVVLTVTQLGDTSTGDRIQIFRFDRTSKTAYRYSDSPDLLYELQLNSAQQLYGLELLALPNSELLLKFSRGIYNPRQSTLFEPSVHLYHLAQDGGAASNIWEGGHYQVTYPGLVTYTAPGFHDLKLEDNGLLWFREIVPPELESGGTYLKSLSTVPHLDNTGIPKTHLFVGPFVAVGSILPLPDMDSFFVYGSTCLIALKCGLSYFGYYALVDGNGVVDPDFNDGDPALVFQGHKEDVAGRKAYRIGNEILVIATMDMGNYLRFGTPDYPEEFINAGNAFYALAFDLAGRVLGNGPFIAPTQGFEIYGDCQMSSDYSGTCAVFNDHFADVRALRWSDPSRIVDPLLDSDGDGIPDIVEKQFGLDLADAEDAVADLDLDGVSNLIEFLRGTNLAFDDVAPELIVPADVNLAAIGAYTPVDLGWPKAEDARDEALDVETDSRGLYPPGRHRVTWTASDSSGNRTTSSQFVNITPLVSVMNEIQVAPGSKFNLRAALNGTPPQQQAIVPLDFSNIYHHFYANHQGAILFNYGNSKSGIELSPVSTTQNHTVEVPVQVERLVNASQGRIITAEIEFADNAIPNFEIVIQQNGKVGGWIEQSGGTVDLSLASDLSEEPSYSYNWSKSDPALLASAVAEDDSLYVDPSQLPNGVYRISVTVDNGVNTLLKTDLLRVGGRSGLSAESDSDGDGEDDWSEGNGDNNRNRVPDHLDPDPRHFLLSMSHELGDLMQTDAVLGLRLGEVAFTLGLGYPLVDDRQVQEVLGAQYALPSDFALRVFGESLVEFEITGLGRVGGQGGLVVPTQTALTAGVSLFWLTVDDGWQDATFGEGNLQIASAPKMKGVCPAGQHVSYTSGLNAGDECIRLLLQDGGEADFDGVLDGTIRFIGGVRVSMPSSEPSVDEVDGKDEVTPPQQNSSSSNSSSSNSGGGGVFDLFFGLILALIILYRASFHRCRIR